MNFSKIEFWKPIHSKCEKCIYDFITEQNALVKLYMEKNINSNNTNNFAYIELL